MITLFGPGPDAAWYLHGLWILLVVVLCASFFYTVLTLTLRHQDEKRFEARLRQLVEDAQEDLELHREELELRRLEEEEDDK